MKEREKQKINPLRLDIDDYVYILKDPTGREGNWLIVQLLFYGCVSITLGNGE
jgi:hypothetical protein